MWSYYGAKTNVVHLYPTPKEHKIIEPFAGSARYSLLYFDNDVTLVDKYEVIIKIWRWLQKCSPKDILSLPRPKEGETLDNYIFDCEEAKLFMGFVVHYGAFSPGKKPCAMKLSSGSHSRGNFMNYTLNRISKELFKIRHWNFILGSYDDIPNQKATWFIDPPYEFGGHKYICSNKDINYSKLKYWCLEREGQIIICENTKATWMKFKPISKNKGSMFTTTEAIWTNQQSAFDNEQLQLFK